MCFPHPFLDVSICLARFPLRKAAAPYLQWPRHPKVEVLPEWPGRSVTTGDHGGFRRCSKNWGYKDPSLECSDCNICFSNKCDIEIRSKTGMYSEPGLVVNCSKL